VTTDLAIKTYTAAVLARVGGPDVLAVGEMPSRAPGPGEVRVRNRAAGVNFIDTIIRAGELPPGAMPPLPHVLGVEGACVVDAIGDGVASLRVGQRVAWFGLPGAGGYGNETVIDARYVVPIADHVSFEAAAAIPANYATAHHMLFGLGDIDAGDWVLVRSAAGGVGTAILQLARNAGARTIAITSGGKLDFVREQGATEAIDYKREDVAARVRAIVGDTGVRLALNAVGGATVADDLGLLGPFGTVVSYGFLGGLPEGSIVDTLVPNFNRSVGLRVSDIYALYTARPATMAGVLQALYADLAAGRISPVIHRSRPIAEAGDAHRDLSGGDVQGKLVLVHD